MVMPKLPFSLFDFKYIDKFEVIDKKMVAAAGVAIPSTTIYTCPDFKFALLLQATIGSIKTTSTEMALKLIRYDHHGIGEVSDLLLNETFGTSESYLSWPMAKASANWALGWTLVFLFPKDIIEYSHALTLAETIVDTVALVLIEYSDPRYPK